MKTKTLTLTILGITVLIVTIVLLRKKGNTKGNTDSSKKAAIKKWNTSMAGEPHFTPSKIEAMSEDEINSFYDFIFTYKLIPENVPVGSQVYKAMAAISAKYGIYPYAFN